MSTSRFEPNPLLDQTPTVPIRLTPLPPPRAEALELQLDEVADLDALLDDPDAWDFPTQPAVP